MAGHQGFRSRSSFRQSRLAFHFRLVTSQKGKVVSLPQQVREQHFALGCLLKDFLGVLQAVKKLIAGGKIHIREGKVRIERDGRLRDCLEIK